MSNGPLKARLFVGGLKSLFLDMANILEEVEKTGAMPTDILESLSDVKDAVDLTLSQLNRLPQRSKRCCEHSEQCEKDEDGSDEDEEDEEEDEEEELYYDDDDDDDEEPEPEPKTATRKPSKKERVVGPSPTVTPVPASKKNKKETRH